MPNYGFATLIESHPVGYEFNGDNIPLHITHVDSFQVDLNPDELANRLQQALVGQKAFAVKAIADARLGPNKDISVTSMELTPEFAEFHSNIMDFLNVEGVLLKNSQFHRESFGPHVSIYAERRLAIGETVLIKNVSIGMKLADRPEAINRIVATVNFEA